MDMPGVFGRVDGRQPLIELRQGLHPRRRDQMLAAEPAALVLHPALLMGAFPTRRAVERREAVPRSERRPPRRLRARAAEQHQLHRRLEVVIPDVDRRHPTQHLERLNVALEERLLRGRGVDPVDSLARVRHPQREQHALAPLPGQVQPHIREIDLGLLTGPLGLRHRPLQVTAPLLRHRVPRHPVPQGQRPPRHRRVQTPVPADPLKNPLTRPVHTGLLTRP